MLAPIRFEGTFYDGGRKIGERSAEKVRGALSRLMPRLRTVYGGNEGRIQEVARDIALKGEESFAASAEYLQGHARGVGIEPAEQKVLSFFEEIYEHGLAQAGDRQHHVPRDRDRCSTLAVRVKRRWFVGHQEDYKGEFKGDMIVTDATFKGYPRVIGAGYPGLVPGISGSLGETGVFVADDALWCAMQPGFPKQPPHFQATLQPTAAGAAACLMRYPPSLTDHFLIIGPDQALSLEVAPVQNVRGAAVDLLVLDKRFKACTHANNVKRLRLRKPDPAPPGSRVRQALLDAIAECEPPQTFEAMQERMMARDGVLNRDEKLNWTTQKDSETLVSVIAAPSEKRITIVRYRADGPPVTDAFQL